MGKKSKPTVIKFDDNEDAGEVQDRVSAEGVDGEEAQAPEAKPAPEPEAGEKKKRKRERKSKKEASAVEEGADGGDGVKAKSRKATEISGGTGTVVGESALPAAASALANDATVYIEGLPYEATEQHVRDFFNSCGNMVSLRLPTWQDSGRLRGYGHIEFGDAEGASKALEKDGAYLMKRYVKVERPKVPKAFLGAAARGDEVKVRPSGCKMVFVKNIPYDCSEEDVSEALKVCGPVKEVRLARWGHTNALKGFCYVDFKREDSCDIAVKKSGVLNINGRPLVIDFETGVAKQGYKAGKR